VDRPEDPTDKTFRSRCEQIYREASASYQAALPWTLYYDRFFGAEGMIAELFPEQQEQLDFAESAYCHAIRELLSRLQHDEQQRRPRVTHQVITVRLPQEVHRALLREAHAHELSLNKLCLAKLLVPITSNLLPTREAA